MAVTPLETHPSSLVSSRDTSADPLGILRPHIRAVAATCLRSRGAVALATYGTVTPGTTEIPRPRIPSIPPPARTETGP